MSFNYKSWNTSFALQDNLLCFGVLQILFPFPTIAQQLILFLLCLTGCWQAFVRPIGPPFSRLQQKVEKHTQSILSCIWNNICFQNSNENEMLNKYKQHFRSCLSRSYQLGKDAFYVYVTIEMFINMQCIAFFHFRTAQSSKQQRILMEGYTYVDYIEKSPLQTAEIQRYVIF